MKRPNPTDLRVLFASHGMRYTRQRAELYAALASTTTHPTAEELFELTRRGLARESQGPARALSLSTVYSTLETLVERGLCRRMMFPGRARDPRARGVGSCRFDADVSEHVHVVMGDGSVRDVPGELASRLMAGLFGGAPNEAPGSRNADRAGRGGVVGDVERAMGVRIARANLQLMAEE